MRRLFTVTLLLALTATLAILLFPRPAAAQTTGNPNPHGCNFTAADFPLPQAPECDNPPAGYWDCITLLQQAYRNTLAANENLCCTQIGNSETDRRIELMQCQSNYNNCINHGGSQTFCDMQRRDCQRETNRVWDIVADQYRRQRDEANAAALNSFIAQAKLCCEGH